jgi:hypothetical protein
VVLKTAWRPHQSTVDAAAALSNNCDRFVFDSIAPHDLSQFDRASSGELTPGADEDLQSPLPLQDPVAVLPPPPDDWDLMPLPEPITGYEQARYHRDGEYVDTKALFSKCLMLMRELLRRISFFLFLVLRAVLANV